MKYTPETRQRAIDEYKSNSGLLYQKLREKYGVPASMINGAKQQALSHKIQECFINDQEKVLVE